MRINFFGGGRPNCLLVCVVHFCIRRCLDVPTVCLWCVLPVSEPQVCGGVQREAHWGYEWNHLAHAGCCSGTHGPEKFSYGEKWHYSCCWTPKCQDFVSFVDLFVLLYCVFRKKNSFLHMFFFKPVSGEGANSHMTPMSKQSTGNMDVGYGGANNVVNNGLSANQNQVRTKVKCCTESWTCINRELKTFICTAKPAKH